MQRKPVQLWLKKKKTFGKYDSITQRQNSAQSWMIYFPFHLNAFAMNYVVKESFASQDSVSARGLVSWETTSSQKKPAGQVKTQPHWHRLRGTLHSWPENIDF